MHLAQTEPNFGEKSDNCICLDNRVENVQTGTI